MAEGLIYCRKCTKGLAPKLFYEATDKLLDTNGFQSICKNCIQDIYDFFYGETGSMEKTIHKMCQAFNVKFSNEACSATQSHISTLLEGGKQVNYPFGIYKSKLTATNKSMDKSNVENLTYEDVGTIYVDKQFDTKEVPIPEDVLLFWGREFSKGDIEYLEREYANFKKTHSADTYAEVVLLKEVCYTMLGIKGLRISGDDTQKEQKTLQDIMTKLAISPNSTNSSSGASGKGADAFGLWIQDIEREEPAQWLKTDPRGDMYRDVGNVEEYFSKYIVRPLKNFITSSKDFNIDDDEIMNDDEMFSGIDDGEAVEG